MQESRNCPHCKTPNEVGRDVCWQCFQPLFGAASTPTTRSSASSIPPPPPVEKSGGSGMTAGATVISFLIAAGIYGFSQLNKGAAIYGQTHDSQQCKQWGRDDAYCSGLYEAVQTACEERQI